jgi:hypothetical protein
MPLSHALERRSVSFRTGKLSVVLIDLVLFDTMESLAYTKENKDV